MPKKKILMPISQRALLARINRKLSKDYEKLAACRQNGRGYSFLGDYFRLDTYRNEVKDTHVDLEDLGRELKVLAEWEKLEAEK